MSNFNKKLIIGCFIGGIAVLTAFSSFVSIGAGTVGVQTLFGKTKTELLYPGAYFLNPLSVVNVINLRSSTVSDDSSGASSDLQNVQTTLTMVYSIDPKFAISIYNKVGDSSDYMRDNIIKPAMSESFKAVVAQYNASELIDSRAAVSLKMSDLIQQKLEQYGVTVQMVSVTNFQFSDQFNQAIENKMVAEQQVQTLQQNLDQAKIAAQIKITQAQGSAQSEIAQAQGDAQAEVTRAQADAKAMSLKSQTVTPEIIQLKAVEAWDGHLPNTMAGNIPFIMGVKNND